MREEIVELISKETKLKKSEVENLLEIPPSDDLGDFAFPCFVLAKKLKKSPLLISEELTEKLRKKLPSEVSNVDFKSAYVNFFVDKKALAENVLKEAAKKDFGKNNSGKGKKLVIDMSAPNIAKPFGIGHLRSTIIGDSISRLAKLNSWEVVKINYLGDWGTQFGKLVFAYKKWGKEKELKKDAIKHLQELYVKVNKNDKFDDAAREEFKKLEDGDKENLKLWKEFKDLSLKKFEEVYKLLNVEFDVVSGESMYNDKLESVVKLLEKKKLLVESEGASIVDLTKENKGVVLIKKSDGTSLYATRDLAAAIERKKEYKFDKLIYEVGTEQRLHFEQVFRVLGLAGFSWSKDCVHAAHGLYLGKDGKKLSTRQGKTVYMEDVLEDTVKKAKANLSQREKLSSKELDKRSLAIALAAIKYGDLKNFRENNIIFDVDRFLQFEGDTGPYLLYSYARANSILRHHKGVPHKGAKSVKILDLKSEEIALLKKINNFPAVVSRASEQLSPNLVANYCYELAKLFNEFYHACPVLGSEEEGFRLKLLGVFKGTLKKGLGILGIETLEKM